MNKTLKYLLLSTICIFFAVQSAYAGGPWANGKNKGYLQLGFTYIKYNTLLTYQFDENPTLRRYVTDVTIQAYGEYGLTDRISVGFALPVKLTSTDGELQGDATLPGLLPTGTPDSLAAGSLNGLSNVMLSAKYTIKNDGVSIAGQVKVETRTSRVDQNIGLRTGYDTWAIVPSVLVGGGLGKGYIYGDFGTAIRTNEYNNEIRATIEGGYQPFNNFWTALVIDVRRPYGASNVDDGTVLHSSLYVNQQRYEAWGLKLAYNFTDNLGVTSGVYGAFGGEWVAAFPALNLGIAYQW